MIKIIGSIFTIGSGASIGLAIVSDNTALLRSLTVVFAALILTAGINTLRGE